jgi:hypothetical protein
MHRIYRLSETPCPAKFDNVVPGEFPERLHGESYVSRGMAMSPWMPPTYLWLGIEGLLGLQPGSDEIVLEPSLPAVWKWLAVNNLLYRGESISIFIFDGVLYSTHAVTSSFPVRVGRLIPIQAEEPFCIALEVDGSILLFAVSDQGWEGSIELEDKLQTYPVHLSLKRNEAVLCRVTEASGIIKEGQ